MFFFLLSTPCLCYFLLHLVDSFDCYFGYWLPLKVVPLFLVRISTSGAVCGEEQIIQVSTMGTKWDIEKFSGNNDFGLWKVKMEAILIQQKCVEVLKGEAKMAATLSQAEKTEMIDKARSAIILCLGDKVLREVTREKTAEDMWTKLESLYMTKSLAHRLCLKQ